MSCFSTLKEMKYFEFVYELFLYTQRNEGYVHWYF